MRFFVILLAALTCAGPAWSERRAVVIGNADYRNAPDLAGSDTVALAAALRDAGFDTTQAIDAGAQELRDKLAALASPDPDDGARIVALNGRFLHDAGETWFMGTDAQEPDRLNADLQGVPLSLVMRLIADRQPGAVLILGTDGQTMPHRFGLESGVGEFAVPPGIAVICGTPETAARALAELLRGSSAEQAVSIDQALLLLPGSQQGIVPVPRAALPQPTDPLAADRAAWAQAAQTNTTGAYSEYLARFPRGFFAAAARERMARIDDFANDRPATTSAAEQTEDAMALDGAKRAAIQRRLSRLGFDSGTEDGIFGRKTRAAIAEWQSANQHDPTGYMTPAQLDAINLQAAFLDGDNGRRDREFWRQTGARGDPKGLRTYLHRYPNGIHAETARRMLNTHDGSNRQNQPQGDDATWRWARGQGTAAAYETYLERYPNGRYAPEVRARLLTLSAGTEAARREEAALHLGSSTRLLIEQRLRNAGLRPGPVDGQLTDETREALRRYQEARNLRVTGYVTQETIGWLLGDVISR